MTYVKRFLFLLAMVVVGIIALPLIVFDLVCFAVYYVCTGRFYPNDYNPLLLAIIGWCAGQGWHWRINKGTIGDTVNDAQDVRS